MLYEVAVVHTDEKDKETLVLAPTPILAPSEDVAKIYAAKLITAKLDKLDAEGVTVLIRPFVE